MVPDLVGDDIRLGEIAGRTVAFTEIAIKAEIDIDFVIARTVERPHSGFAATAGGLHRTGKQDEFRLLITLPLRLK